MSEVLSLPGLVDVHVHFREPGSNKSETIENGSLAALHAGYAVVADMPNNPDRPTWSNDALEEKQHIAKNKAWIPIGFHAGSQPESENIVELDEMSKKAVGLKIYGSPNVSDHAPHPAEDFREIVSEWHRVAPDKPILFHRGKNDLEQMIELVAEEFSHPLHICHVNSPEEVSTVNLARESGDLPVTCGVCPHHLLKTSYDVHTEGEFAKMLPPLAHQDDAEKLMHLLDKGDIDIIESDYAPHSKEAKWKAEHESGNCYGVGGIEHIVPQMLRQVELSRLSLDRMIDAMSTKPATLLGITLDSKTYTKWSMDEFRIETESDLVSGPKWSPYLGNLAVGKLIESKIHDMYVYFNGRPVEQSFQPISNRGIIV